MNAERFAPKLALATLAKCEQFDFQSVVNGHSYRVQIALPVDFDVGRAYPVLYAVDGDMHFSTIASAARMRSLVHEIEPCIVVGIGYPETQSNFLACLQRRNADLTPTSGTTDLHAFVSQQLDGLAVNEFGKANLFLDVIETEIKPRIQELVPRRQREILFGHSLGGLFALHTLFTRPTMFSTYLSLSPSIWWDDCAVLKMEEVFVDLVNGLDRSFKLYVGVGEYEQSPSWMPQLSPDAVIEAAMVDNAVRLALRLSGKCGVFGNLIEHNVFKGESHMAVATTAINALLDFALPGPTLRAQST